MQKFFTIAELTASQYAIRNNIDNTPPQSVKLNLIELIDNVLLPIRMHFGKPVIISSGFRSPRLNRAIGGVITSDHCTGRAADFTVHGFSNFEVCEWIAENLKFKQCIYEFGEAGWIHVSYDPRELKNETLSAVKIKGKTAYLHGFQ